MNKLLAPLAAALLLLAGRIERIKDMPYGQLTLAMRGDNIVAALAQLRAAGVDIEEVAR